MQSLSIEGHADRRSLNSKLNYLGLIEHMHSVQDKISISSRYNLNNFDILSS